MGLLNPGGPIAQFKRNCCSISPVEVILLSGVRTLKALTPEERDIIMNFYFSENPLSGEALAEKFATTKSSIYRRRDHALRKLKSILGFLFLTAIRRCTKIAKVVVYQRKNLEKRGFFCYN